MTSVTKRVWIALYNMGGPQEQQDVEPFLRALFTDPDLLDIPLGVFFQSFVANKIIQKRLEEVKKRYQHMGGGSPQFAITQALAIALSAELQSHQNSQLNTDTKSARFNYRLAGISPLMRYSEPRALTILNQCYNEKIDELWLLSQYPHCARPTTGTSLREIALEKKRNAKFDSLIIRSFASYGDDPAFLDLWTQRVKDSWNALPEGRRHLLISAHNLPLSYVAEGDPYPLQIRRTAQEVTRRLQLAEDRDWTLCWQSAVGPVRWMSPTTEHSIERLCARGVEHFLVWPVAFVSDHIETRVEIDLEYADFAKQKGAKSFSRVGNLNADFDFVSFLARTIHSAAQELATAGRTKLLRNFEEDAAGPFCSAQPGGCLCANYYLTGLSGQERGTRFSRIDASFKR